MEYLLLLPAVLFLLVQLIFAYFLLTTYRHSKQRQQIVLFVLLSTTLSVWSVVNTSIELPVKTTENLNFFNIINQIGFFLGALAAVQIYNFAFYYPKKTPRSLAEKALTLLLVCLTPLTLLQVVAGTYYFDTSLGEIEYVFDAGWFPYIVGVTATMILSVVRMSLSMKEPSVRTKHMKTIGLGILFTILHAVIFTAILPIMFGYQPILYTIGYLAPVYLVVATSYGMIKQQVFDISAVAVRMLLNVLATAGFVVAYITVLYVGGSWLLSHPVSLIEFSLICAIALSLVFVYRPVGRRIEHTLDEVVTKEVYDPQDVLDELNQVLVVDSDIETLLDNVSTLLARTFRSTYIGFYLRETSYSAFRFVSNPSSKKPNDATLDQIRQVMSVIDRKIFSIRQEPSTIDERLLKEILQDNATEILCRLVNTTEYKVAGVGYFLVGPRKDGSPYSSNDLKVLQIIANGLVVAIENALRFEEIEHFNVTLQKKIDDATQELKQSNQKLMALDEAKDEFVSLASHQLRTPLTSIKGYISMVLEGDAGKVSEPQSKMLAQALFSAQRMVYLIGDLLNMSRLKTGKFVIDAKPVLLNELVASEVNQLRDSAAAKNLTLSYDKPADFPVLKIDDNKIRQVIMNFIDNAIHYTKSGGKISVELKNKRDSIEFLVKDNGLGVPKAAQHKLFAQFYRAENARKARPDGTGLGLFMAKKVIIAQGGSVIFTSKEGKGSTFGFSFPKARLEVVDPKA